MTKLTLYAVAITNSRGEFYPLHGTNAMSRALAVRLFMEGDPERWNHWRRRGYRTVRLECVVKE